MPEAQMARVYLGFLSMKYDLEYRYCYSPPGWVASPSQGYPQQYVTGAHLKQWTKVPCLRNNATGD